MANVSSSNGLEKYPKLRFKGFSEPWEVGTAEELFDNVVDKNHPEETVLTIIQGQGTLPREAAGRNIHYDTESLSGYKRVMKNDYVIHLRSFEGGLEIANSQGIVSPAYTILRSKQPCAPLFFDSYFHTDEFINHVLYKAVEGIRDGRQISYEAFKWLSIPYCSFEEQTQIAAFIEKINVRIEKQRSLVENLKKYKRGVMREIFETKTLFSSHHYSLVQLGNECRFFSGGTPQSGNSKYYGGSIPFIRSGEVHKSITELTLTEEGLNNSSAKMVEVGDLIMALYGATSGEVDISKISGAINQAILCIRPNTINRHYLKFLFECKKEDILKTYLQGGQGNLSAEIIKKLCFEIPLPSEQQETVDFLVALENKISLEDSKLEKLFSVRNGLLQQLFI